MALVRWLPLGAVLVLLAGAGTLGWFYLFQRSLLYDPDPARPDRAAVGVAGLRDVSVTTADGLSLHGWYLPPADGQVPVVAYLHGNGGSIAGRAPRIRRFAAAGWGGLFLDYRGFGGNPGAPSEAGLLRDARAGLAFLDGLGLGARLVLYGESLGSGIAVAMAAERPVAAVILESPYSSIAAIAKLRYPLLPVDLLLRDRFDALARIGAVRAPLLVLQGGRDTVIPNRLGQQLYDAAPDPKRLWRAAAGGHGDLFRFGALDQAIAFVEALPVFLH